MDAKQVLAEEVQGDGGSDQHRSPTRHEVGGGGIVEAQAQIRPRKVYLQKAADEAHDVSAGGDAAGWPRQNVIEHQG